MGQIEQVDMLITDSGADPAVIRRLRDAGVKVEVV
jgi:DeoR/GlpR family transcriptional regulator of sugar metabolism